MHPEFLSTFAEQRRDDLARAAAPSRPTGRRLRRPARRRRPASPGIFAAGTDAYSLRLWVTPGEARRLAHDVTRLLDKYADRADHPERRPADAVGMEVAVLGRRLPELAGACATLPGQG